MSQPTVATELPEQLLRAACAQLRHDLRNGQTCRSEDLLQQFPELAVHPEAALELVYTEFVVREELGQQSSLAQWQARFPQLQERLQRLLHLHDAMESAVGSGTPRPKDTVTEFISTEDGPAPPRVGGYEILDEIGRGGMGVVYRARQPGLQRLVALKMILSGGFAGPEELSRFRTEAEAAARLQHPGIVQIFEVGVHEDRPFLVLEYVAGGTLAQRLRRGPLPQTEAAALTLALAHAVQHAHERGVVHRDLKPANVLVVSGESPSTTHHASLTHQPKITDFGLAKQVQVEDAAPNRTQTGILIGTPSYMAPEQAEGSARAASPAVDIYGLGAILYECLTGRPPFQGATMLDTLEHVRSEDPVPPSRLQAKLSRDLETICLTCLRKEPGQRYASARALAEDLQRFLAGEPIKARPAGVRERLVKWVRRHPTVASLLALVTVGTAAALAVVTALWLETAAALEDAEEARLAQAAQQQRAEQARNAEAGAHERAEANLYAKQLLVVRMQWENLQFDQAKKTLLECDPARRDREWRYLHRVLHAQLWHKKESMVFWGLKFDPDGGRIAVYNSVDVHLLDATSGRESIRITGQFSQVAFQAGKNCLVTERSPTIAIYDLETGNKVSGFEIKGRVMSLTLSPRGNLAACLNIGNEFLWYDPADGKVLLHSSKTENIWGMTWSGDGKRLSSGGFGTGKIAIWDTESKSLFRTLTVQLTFATKSFLITRTALDYHGDHAAVVYNGVALGEPQGCLEVFDTTTGRSKFAKGQGPAQIGDLAFCPRSKRLAIAYLDGSIVIWDLRTNTEQLTFRLDSKLIGVRHLAFSPDGRRLIASDGQTLWMWDSTPLEQ
jgi:hypothetical protein